MSYFQGNTQETNTENNTNNQGNTNQSNQEDYIAKVVADKGDQWSDPQVIAKGYVSSQEYISQLETQASELREDLSKQDYAKTLLEQLANQGKPHVEDGKKVSNTEDDPNKGATTPSLGADELKNLIKSTLAETNAQEVVSNNLRAVDAKLTELFGTDAEARMNERSKELGMSKERLQEIAGESPNAFFKLIGEEPIKKETNHTPTSTINTSIDSFAGTSKERDWAWYQNLRKTNKRLYYDPKTQQQLLQDKLRLGASFGN